MKAMLMILVLVGTLLRPAPAPADEPPSERFEEVKAKATQMGDSEEGKEYQKRSADAFYQAADEALKGCKERYTTGVLNLVFVVSADGTVERVIQASDEPMSSYFAKKFTGLQLPAPPRAGWLLTVKLKLM